jgi:hypothetical protein
VAGMKTAPSGREGVPNAGGGGERGNCVNGTPCLKTYTILRRSGCVLRKILVPSSDARGCFAMLGSTCFCFCVTRPPPLALLGTAGTT